MPISILMKPSSGQCNMHCDYCFYCDEMQNREQASYGFMSEDTLRSILKKVLLSGTDSVSVAFQGGEPTLRGLHFFRAAVNYEKKYNHRKIPVHNAFQTNGYLLNEEWCRFFHDNHFLVGVSVDGTEFTHDRFRHGPGSSPTHAHILKNIELLEQYHVDYNILTVVNHVTAAHIEEIYAFYKEKGWIYQQYIPCLSGFGQEDQTEPWTLTSDDYSAFMIRLFNLWYADWQNGIFISNRTFENYLSILLGIPPEACDQRGICGIQYVAEADGSCYPCDFYMLDEMCLGNFNSTTLKEMDQKRNMIGFIERSMQVAEKCRACRWRTLCRNGCQRMRILDKDELYRNQFCSAYTAFFEACAPRLQEIALSMRRR